MTVFKSSPIVSNWRFKQVGAVGVPDWTDGFLSVSQFPTNVHLDLMKHGKIPDPYMGLNEFDVQWVGEQQWLYRADFHHGGQQERSKCVLRFEGLDTFATVSFNGQDILKSDNAHRTYRVDVTEFIKQGINQLDILFDVALIRGRELLDKFAHHTIQFDKKSEKSRVFVRKPQYHYGWNWGPELTTCGPWRPVVLEEYSSKVSDLSCQIKVDMDTKTAVVKIAIQSEGCVAGDTISVSITDPKGDVIHEVCSLPINGNHAYAEIEIQDAQFWWPIGYGHQPLYTVSSDLFTRGACVHSITKRIGLREAQIVRRPLTDAPGTSFFMQVNQIPIFSNGSNWCPADHFVPRVSPERYRLQLNLLAEGNQNTVRVWAGGIFEEDIFYDICDELGILVWQDFLFACAAYPAHDDFIQNITAEVVDNVTRLRHHPSIVAWNGNNEDYLFAELFKTNYDIKDTDPENWLKSTFPSRYIYEVVLPDLCRKLIPDASYHPGSPWGGESFNDSTVGDTHRWEVWHYLLPWQSYDSLKSRFISEFGMASLPHVKTVESYLVESPDFERHPHSRTVDEHNKEYQHERKLATYLVENYRYTYALEDYIYVSQLNQAEALSCALENWHREWKGSGNEYCGGALIWQLNSTWQVTSKALIDYYNRPKMAYFTVKRDMAPITLGMKRKTCKISKFKVTRAFMDEKTTVEGWATNLTLSCVRLVLSLQVFELSTGKEVLSKEEPCELPANSSVELFVTELSNLGKTTKSNEPLIVSARLLDPCDKSKVVARRTNWPQPYRYLDMPRPVLQIKVINDAIYVKANVPVKGLWLYVDKVDSVKFDDNGLDLIPGDEQTIMAKGLGGCELLGRCYGVEAISWDAPPV